MLKKTPNAPDVLFQLGVVSLAEAKYKEAYDAFKRTYELNPANSRGLMGMVETDMAENKPDEAIKVLEAEAAEGPNRLDVQLALGDTEVRAGRYDLALGYFNRVLNGLDKTSKVRGDVLMRIGETYRRKGDLQASINALQEARKYLPDNPIILSTLALVLDAAGQYSQANSVHGHDQDGSEQRGFIEQSGIPDGGARRRPGSSSDDGAARETTARPICRKFRIPWAPSICARA